MASYQYIYSMDRVSKTCPGGKQVLKDIQRCAPGAIATTKRLMLDVGSVPLDALLDRASQDFARAMRDGEGIEGMMACIEKRKARWADGGA